MNRPFLQKARTFAIEMHRSQKYGIYPYEVHLGHVVSVLLRFGVMPDSEHNVNLIAAAWLHDVLQSTPITYTALEAAFNTEVAKIVFAATDEPDDNFDIARERALVKLTTHPAGAIVKLADRIADVEFSLISGYNDVLTGCKNDQPGFEAAIKAGLDNLVYRELLGYLKRCYTSYLHE
jgi:(p)ppGpp synthase/HD superfamily hydrolase